MLISSTMTMPAIISPWTQLKQSLKPKEIFKSEELKQTERSPRPISWLRSITASFVEGFKSFMKTVVRLNPFTHLMNFIQNMRSTEAHDEIKKEDIYRFHKSSKPGPRTQVILILGNEQTQDWPEDKAGLIKLYNKLKADDDCDLMLCRVGSAIEGLKHRYFLSDDAGLRPKVVLDHLKDTIADRHHARGDFADMDKPRNTVIVGYSWGGGALKEILDQWDKIGNGTKVSTSVTVDAVEYGLERFGDELKHKPQNTDKHINITQNNSFLVNGASLSGMGRGDSSFTAVELGADYPDHNEVEDEKVVLDKIYKSIREVIERPLISQEA